MTGSKRSMRGYIFFGILLAIFSVNISQVSFAQSNRIVPVKDKSYEYIKRLQHRGHLLDLNPTALPYVQGDVIESIKKIDKSALDRNEKEWVKILEEEFGVSESESLKISDELSANIILKGGTSINNSKRKNALRPLNDDIFLYPFGQLSGFLESDNFIAEASIRHDLYYDRDPDGIDTARRLYIRNEDMYLGYNGKLIDVYLGRFGNHWAPYNETSSILSDNPRSFDQISFTFGNSRISLKSIMGELDNINESNEFTGMGLTSGSKRRYFVGHRFDWRPTQNFGLAYFESMVYSGFNSGLSFKYLNPLPVLAFVSANFPENDENNLLMGIMMWGRWKHVTLNGQFMLDDVQVEDKVEPITFTSTASLNIAELFSNVDAGVEFEAVAYQSYNAEEAEGRYLYLKRGIATQYNDYILTRIFTKIYVDGFLHGFSIKPAISLLAQGEQIINQPLVKTKPDGSPMDVILTGTVEQTVRPSLEVLYYPSGNFWLEIDAGYNFTDNWANMPGIENDRFVITGEFGFKISLDSIVK